MSTHDICLWVMMVMALLISTSVRAMPQRHKLSHNEREFINNIRPTPSLTANAPQQAKSIYKTSTYKENSKNGRKPETGTEIDAKNDFSSLSIDDIYDYDYLDYLYQLDFLDPLSTKTDLLATTKKSITDQRRISVTNAAIKKNNRDTFRSNNDADSFPKENVGKNSTSTEEPKTLTNKTGTGTSTKQMLLDGNKNTIHFQTTSTSDNVANESSRNYELGKDIGAGKSKTNSELLAVPDSSSDVSTISKNKDENLTNDKVGWTSSRSSVSYEVRVQSSSSVSSYKYPRKFVKDSISKSSNNNNFQKREILELEVSATPKTINLDKERSKKGKTKTSFDDKDRSEIVPNNATRIPISIYPTSSSKLLLSPVTPKQDPTTQSPLSYKTQPASVTKVTTTSTTPIKTFHSEIQAQLTTSNHLSTPSIVTVMVTTPLPRVNQPTKWRPFAFLRRLNQGTQRKLNLPPLFPRHQPTATSEVVRKSRANQKLFSSTPGRGASNTHRTKSRNIISRSLLSQLGRSPHGINPAGATPLGLNPLGSSPFGLSPQGLAPLGVAPLHRPSINVSATTTNSSSSMNNKTEEDMKQERYHVQVKKPDGSINGDYIVLDHKTGSFSGVRYDAVDGADQSLIQQALMSFLSLDDPGLDSLRSEKSLNGELTLGTTSHRKSLDLQKPVILPTHYSELGESSISTKLKLHL